MAAFSLQGKTALVTGGARGIGFATARTLLARGARVAIVDLHEEAVQRAAGELHATDALGLAADVTDRAAMQRAVAMTVERFGSLDVVVANAGVAPRIATLNAMAPESFERVLDVNVLGVARTVQAALPEIVARSGHVVVIASIYAFINGAGATPYAMSKAAVEQLGRALRVELAQHGAGASVAYFGFIETEMVHGAIDGDPLASTLFQRLPRPLRKRVPASAAGEAIVSGIERRRPQIFCPRRWALMSVLRGVLGPLSDTQLTRDEQSQSVVRLLDGRGEEEQPTTA
ncbi:MAG TPA: short-chain dehydrogenase/reductase [Solirubrobacteraceae bacterium]|nr:short-chain dehydrogenase/reductase [Solirubrobacteraceae bacterium]